MESLNYEQLINELPQKPPFRFVDQIHNYAPGHSLMASVELHSLQAQMKDLAMFPAVCVVEGLAQAAVLLIQLETGPLLEGEIPILGSLSVDQVKPAAWQEQLIYEVELIRLLTMQARVRILARNTKEILVKGELSLAKTQMSF